MVKKRKVAPRLNKFQPLTKNSMVLRSTVTRDAVAARFAAKEEGQAASVRIAKARAAKKKKAPLTKLAESYNDQSRTSSKNARDLTKYLAYDEGYYTKTKRGNAYLKKRVLAKQAQLEAQGSKVNPIYSKYKENANRAGKASVISHAYARKSGGYATSMKRNAESGLSHIVRGRALKNVARSGGALGLVSMFMNHINTKEKNNG